MIKLSLSMPNECKETWNSRRNREVTLSAGLGMQPWLPLQRGALGYIIRNCKTEEKIIQNRKTAKKKSTKTENRTQNHQKPIQWWQVGHTEQITLIPISAKYLWMSWTCLKPLYLLVSISKWLAINCRSNRRETSTQIGQNRKNQKPNRIPKLKNR